MKGLDIIVKDLSDKGYSLESARIGSFEGLPSKEITTNILGKLNNYMGGITVYPKKAWLMFATSNKRTIFVNDNPLPEGPLKDNTYMGELQI